MTGGICFRAFWDFGVIEVVFCAVALTEHLKGYGTFVMNQLKAFALRNGCLNFLTFADNEATLFFEKQGYTANINIPKNVTDGLVKTYEGGVLMQCPLYEKAAYGDLPGMSVRHRKILQDTIKA